MARPTPPEAETLHKLMPKGPLGMLHKFEGIAEFEAGDDWVFFDLMKLRWNMKIFSIDVYFDNIGHVQLSLGKHIHNQISDTHTYTRDFFSTIDVQPDLGYTGYYRCRKPPMTTTEDIFITIGVKQIVPISGSVSVVVEYEDRNG